MDHRLNCAFEGKRVQWHVMEVKRTGYALQLIDRHTCFEAG